MDKDSFLVCGLGGVGQHCVANLKTFGVRVSGVDLAVPARWEVPQLPDLLHHLEIGDCRYEDVLERAGVRDCRAVLLVTENERVNLEAALTARVLNPSVRLVVRSEKQNLNELLCQQLDNFVAFEPTQLAAPAFALEAYSESLLGFFSIGDDQFRVVRQQISPEHRWCDQRRLYELENRQRRILRHLSSALTSSNGDASSSSSPSSQFYTWLPNTVVRRGDEVVLVELRTPESDAPRHRHYRLQQLAGRLEQIRSWFNLRQLWRSSFRHQIRRVALLCGLTVLGLCVAGTLLLYFTSPNPELRLRDAFYGSVVLLLGGYGDLFSELVPEVRYPETVRLFSLLLTLAGTAFIGVLYALLTEKLLTARFEFLERRPPVPETAHVIVISLGRVGRRVVELLQELKQPVVGITSQAVEPDLMPQMPLIRGDIQASLAKANLARARSVVAVSDDEIQNLELGLMAYRANPDCRLIIRTYDRQLTDRITKLFPYVHGLCASAISAEAFAGAAFGEHVLSIFRLYHQMVLVTEYLIEPQDTLQGFLLAEVAYGYGVVPIWYQRPGRPAVVMPSPDLRLHPGDKLVLLATIRGLRRIEQGHRMPQRWRVHLEAATIPSARFEGAAELSQATGCSLGTAREFMAQLPGTFPQKLYRHQALRLLRRLVRSQIKAQIVPPNSSPNSSPSSPPESSPERPLE